MEKIITAVVVNWSSNLVTSPRADPGLCWPTALAMVYRSAYCSILKIEAIYCSETYID